MAEARSGLDIAIIGGGIAGLTLAIALHHANSNLNVTIYEQAHHFGEIGAGVSFSPNAVQAMKVCHQGVYEAFEKVCTRNQWESKQNVWFDYLDGYRHDKKEDDAGHEETNDVSTHPVHQEAAFTITSSLGQNGVHRAHFLDELVNLLPSDGSIAKFGKRLKSITTATPDHNKGDNAREGRQVMTFEDGTTAEADAIVGCDGIKSRVRQLMFGSDHPCAHPSYTHKYAYRGLVPMDKAVEVVGEERAQNSCMHMGLDGHMLTFPVNHGQVLNIVAFKTSSDDWPDYQKLTRPAKREDALKDFAEFGPNVLELLNLTKPDLDVWAIFDTGKNPVPQFNQGRVCLSGDAAHATSPHHGAGAGFCIEDSAVMASLLSDDRVRSPKDVEAAFAAFDANRRERTQWLVQSSRFVGDCYEWRAEGVGRDFSKIEEAIKERNGVIANVDLQQMCKDARTELARMLPTSYKT